MKQRIGMVLDVSRGFPPDIRVEKEARALIKTGFDVFLLARKADAGQLLRERLDYGIEVVRCELPKFKFYLHPVETFTSIYKVWLAAIEDFVSSFSPDVLHAHDFAIVPTVLRVAKRHNLPVVADLHENLPAAFAAWRAQTGIIQKTADRIARNYYLWRWHERRALPQCDRVIVVVPEATERLLSSYGIRNERIYVVSNTEDETTFNVSDFDRDIVERYEGSWSAIYIGGIGAHRGIDTAIRAAALVGQEIENFKLLIVGVQNDKERDTIIRMAEKVGAGKHTELVDWVPAGKVNSYIAASKVCLVPYNDFEHTNTTVPHKLFQYMIMKKATIVSSCAPLKRIVEDAKCGLVFKANDAEDLARCLVELYKEGPETVERYGENGYRAALGKYSWKHDSARLVNMYRQLLGLEG